MTEPSETEPSKTARSEAEPTRAAESIAGTGAVARPGDLRAVARDPGCRRDRRAAGGALLMATDPLPAAELAQAVRAPVEVVEDALAELARFYDETGRGFELRNVGGGWRYWTRASAT